MRRWMAAVAWLAAFAAGAGAGETGEGDNAKPRRPVLHVFDDTKPTPPVRPETVAAPAAVDNAEAADARPTAWEERVRVGSERLERELREAERAPRPLWLAGVKPIRPPSDNLAEMRGAISWYDGPQDERQRRGNLRLIYELLDHGTPELRAFAAKEIIQGLWFNRELARGIREMRNRRPDDLYLWIFYAYALMEYQQDEEAEAAAGEALRLVNEQRHLPDEVLLTLRGRIHEALGHARRLRGDFVGARTHFDTARTRYRERSFEIERDVPLMDAMMALCEKAHDGWRPWRPGTYRGTQTGGADTPVTVSVEVDPDGRLVAVRVEEQAETVPGLALTLLPARVLADQGPDRVDFTTGATHSSSKVLGATLRALRQAERR